MELANEGSMRAVVMTDYGKEDVVQLQSMPKPKMKADEVLIEVYSAGINPIDVKLRTGVFKPFLKYKFPLILGADIAGKVLDVGSKVSRFKKGDEVYSSFSGSQMGAFAEFVVAREGDLALKPTNSTFGEAASLPTVGLTVYQALTTFAQLQPDQKILVEAGSGGIGSFAIQYAKALGAEVATTTSTKNVDWVRGLGADHVIDYQKQKFEDVLSGYDAVLHTVDAEPTARGYSVLKQGGHLLSLVGPPDFDFAKRAGLNILLRGICALLGMKINKLAKKTGTHYTFVFLEPSGKQLAEIADLVEKGKIKPVIDRVFPMDQVREAFAYVALGRTKGKVVLKIRDENRN
ncbi:MULTISPECIES: NADP-dependent oxidoreductase [unclassified Bradyrhizobium]|uniref:NADP-dependent oxidoreductase n=1 Tax=unclassified Bradyrhizobium TaxID=2631580 RepID=UPI001FFA6EE7|nr:MULTISPECIES: NADP-dependent oxidoreductase [unclassified Bradyrhizobium]